MAVAALRLIMWLFLIVLLFRVPGFRVVVFLFLSLSLAVSYRTSVSSGV